MSMSDAELVQLTVEAEPGTEIFVVDHAFQLRARGVGRLSQPVEAGLYKLKLRAGRSIQEVHQVVRPGSGEVVVRPQAIAFSSAAPLAGTSRTSEEHQRAAETLSRRVHHSFGSGSQLFVFARHHGPDPLPTAVSPGRGLSLHSPHGQLLVDFDTSGETVLEGPTPWCGATVEVDPGIYRLRVATPRWGTLERTLVAAPGWQTQVFLLQSDLGDLGSPELRPDLASAAALMARDQGFVSSSDTAREVELARVALVSGRAVVTADELLAEAGESPMLGILGAHALLLADNPDLNTVDAVADILTERIGPHPDVDALRLGRGDDPEPTMTFKLPPMLTSSWGRAVAASWKQPDLIPTGSLAARAATWFWGYGPWLIWLADAVDDQPPELPSRSLEDALAVLPRLASGRERPIDLTDAEAALLTQVTRASAPPPPSFEIAPEGDTTAAPPTPDDDLARALGLPPAALKTVAASLAEKLSAT